MILSPQELKLQVIKYLKENKTRFEPKANHNYVIECPYCGDSQSSSHGHFYIEINPEDNSAMRYNCFRCPAGGIVTKSVLERLGFGDSSALQSIGVLNRNAPLRSTEKYEVANAIVKFDYHVPYGVVRPEKIDYIEKRMGLKIGDDDISKMKIITSFKQFLEENNITKLTCNREIATILEYGYVGFLSYGNSTILFRDITDKQKYTWLKYPIHEESRGGIIFYSMKSSIDPFTSGDITINLCEGVMDAIGVAYHLKQIQENTINVAVTGKYYERILGVLIKMALVGDNVTVNIYGDNDAVFNPKAVPDTSVEYISNIFKEKKYLFKRMNVYLNMLKKDFGVKKEEISMKKWIL